MEKYDVGITEKEKYGEPVGESATMKNRIIRPSISLTGKQLPPLKGKKFDAHFTIEADVRIEGIRSVENQRKDEITYEIEFLKIGLKSEEKGESPEEYVADRRKSRESKGS